MIRLNDIHRVLEDAIKGAFGAVPVYHDVMPKNFARPSFYIEMQPLRFSPTDLTASTIRRHARFRIDALEKVDEYHNSQMAQLNDTLDTLCGLFCRGYLQIGDRAPHLTIESGEIAGTDAVSILLAFEWTEDLSEFSGETPPEVETLQHITLRQE